ncbi:HAMP domain-containing sensor histidine kinase [Paenibacillus dokdonensis]|uniref:histidine kinase n=1 Tax=Paenibacillus dokdonensis TaxID=2567944 RepID=A0ABU6GSB8_9BACL|nr:HAMP domain-containing sensor histidine kinase [Paenibacillus dokdonensis]MEC0242619.1 HAMP domain-containing sensor histidine kinase [Paenibacillus dokdonensis]
MIKTIRAKFIVGFFLIFCLSFLILNQTVKEIIRTSNQNIVTADLIGLKNNSNVYIRQAFLINHFKNNKLYFGEMAEEMVDELNHVTASNVSAYTIEGILLFSSDQAAFSGRNDDDLKQAIEGKTAYTITHEQNTGTVLFSYPVIIDGVKVGILRFSKDFNLLYKQSGRILDIIFYIALAIFTAAFLFSYLLSRHITIPLIKLTRASTEVKNGNLNVRIDFQRKDEIGRLAVNFNDMIDRISSQISTIERDRDRLKDLNEQEKRFFDNVTHELKTPLTSILGYAEMIREKGEADRAFFDKGMNHIVEESRRLHSMVLKLLEVSHSNSGGEAFEMVDTSKILQDVCDSMSFRAKRYKKRIMCEMEENLLVHGQADRLRQLFINILDNAIKYSTSQSKIWVKAELHAGTVRYIFDNRGEPIAPDQLANLFQPFYSANQKLKEEGSVGLGLSIVKSIVDDHAGTIRIVSENGHTIVYVEIPYMKAVIS